MPNDDVTGILERARKAKPPDHDEVMRQLERDAASLSMTAQQQRQIMEMLLGMGFADDGPQVTDIMYRIGASPNAWRWRALTQPQANSMIELLARFLESHRR
jgi:hypothetical protein